MKRLKVSRIDRNMEILPEQVVSFHFDGKERLDSITYENSLEGLCYYYCNGKKRIIGKVKTTELEGPTGQKIWVDKEISTIWED